MVDETTDAGENATGADKDEETGVRMVSLRTHKLANGTLARTGEEFTATEEEARAYALKDNPLAGPLEAEEAPKRSTARRKSSGKSAKRRTGR